MGVLQAIRESELVLPGTPVKEGEDLRWQAIIAVGRFIESNPESVWRFIRTWGRHPDEDLRTAIATCLLEHLLEYHFDRYFPRVEDLALTEPLFADTFLRCWKFGQSEQPVNARRFDALTRRLENCDPM